MTVVGLVSLSSLLIRHRLLSNKHLLVLYETGDTKNENKYFGGHKIGANLELIVILERERVLVVIY